MVKTFKIGDKVFAKVKGYPHWPARIVEDKGKKYGVIFYGTQETGNIKVEDIIYYLKNKDAFQKHSKRAGYADALEQIEADVKKDGGDGDTTSESFSEVFDESVELTDTSSNTSKISDKKGTKRKVSSSTEEATVLPVTKAKKGRKSTTQEVKETIQEKEDNNEESKLNSDGEKSEGKKGSAKKQKRGRQSLTKEKPKTEIQIEESEDIAEDTIEVEESKVNDIKSDPKDLEEEPVDKTEGADVDTEPKGGSSYETHIVTEKLLKNNILYAEHVRKHESIYKPLPVESRPDDSQDQIFPVILPTNTVCGIKLHKNWPLHFSNEYERALYDETVAKSVLSNRDQLVSGKITELENAEIFVPKLNVTADDIKEVAYKTEIDSKKKRIDRLNIESNLINIDGKIKQCLGLEAADPDAALKHLKELLSIKFDELMLKKHVHVVDMIRRLQKYIGNTKEWNMTEEDLQDFQKKAEKIRVQAEKVFNRIKETVTLVEDQSENFWDSFLGLIAQFREDCKDLDEAQIQVLCAEPHSREAFFHKMNAINTESVVSNGVSNSEAILNKSDERTSPVQGWAEKTG